MILVTGGTGLVGSHLLYFLLKDNQNVRAIHRRSSDLEAVKAVFSYYTNTSEAERLFSKIVWFEANITEVPELSEAFKDVTKVYHAAAYISFNPKHYYKLKKANIEGTANVVNLCLMNKVEKLVYVSSIATLGASENGEPISEKTDWNPEAENSVYAITKFGAEMEVWRGSQEGLNVIIVNPGIIIGSGYWKSGSGVILNSVAKGIPFYTSGGIGIVDIQDVVHVMTSLMESTLANERYVLVGKSIYYKELLSELAILLDKKPPKKLVPKIWLRVFSKIDWMLNKVFGKKRIMLKSTVRSLYKISFYDASKIRNDLDFEFTPYSETLERVAKDYRKDHSNY
jgi:nucleoside-diphosphate-sugar epimerase